MISPRTFCNQLAKNGINFFSGVPDSLLSNFCAYIADNTKPNSHIIAANEGNAIALAVGHYLATGRIGLVYMQNSGLGNSVNPLISLADKEVYGIPMLLLIGWRGEPGMKDEIQHIRQGEITLELLKNLKIPFEILPTSPHMMQRSISKAFDFMDTFSAPYALVVKKDTFTPYISKKKTIIRGKLLREEVIKIITDEFNNDEILISTTGKTSRELFEIRENHGYNHERDFLTVGSMGHSSQIALGVALSKSKSQVYCLDGDGALIMHMGSLAIIGNKAPKNLKHIILNNFAHESVGGQSTASSSMDISAIASACGYKKTFRAKDVKGLKYVLSKFRKCTGPALLEIIIKQGSRSDLKRPSLSPKENKKLFMDFLNTDLQNSSENKLERFLEENKSKRIFLVTGRKSYVKSGAKKMFSEVLSSYRIIHFSDFDLNPKLEDVEQGIKIFRKNRCDIIVAIGGGSVIDIAKLINIFSAQNGTPIDYISGKKDIMKNAKPMIAIPTTAGTGSEATHFAVVYVKGKKYSVAHESIFPSKAIIVPKLTMSMSPRLMAESGMDALCQAIESYWSVNATDESKRFAKNAISLTLNNLIRSVKNPTLKSRGEMARAAYLAGHAINITKTTAPHAISYFLTSNFGISHGHAVALTLGSMFSYNSQVKNKDVIDKRGQKYVRDTIKQLEHLFGVSNPDAVSRKIKNIMKQIGLETSLYKLGISRSDINDVVKSVNIERLKNNPRKLDKSSLKKILISVL